MTEVGLQKLISFGYKGSGDVVQGNGRIPGEFSQ